ncbi:MAG: YciI family protein [Chloroflexota bacterium]
MKYMMMIYHAEAESAQMTEAELMENLNAHMAFRGALTDPNHIGEALQPTVTATTVRVRDGKTLTTDGPFAEAHEQIGGFYLIDCKDMDEALEIAAQIPDAQYGTIEIRPVLTFD